MRYQILFPKGVKRALTFSYDDGQIYDRRLVELFNKYKVKGTFHLNAGKLGNSVGEDLFIEKDEVLTLYKGHEVSCHGYDHPYFVQLSHNQMVSQIYEDKRELERLCKYPVRGMSYPYGEFSKELVDTASALGMEYSRTVDDTLEFNIPHDFMRWNPTCHHSKVFDVMGEFFNCPPYRELMLFYVWGHSFEFNREDNWQLMEDFLAQISGRDDIWYATNIEIVDYINAYRGLKVSVDEKYVYNPSATDVWLKVGDDIRTVKAGEIQNLSFLLMRSY